MSNPYINDVATQKGLTVSAYTSSLMSTLGGAFTMNDVAILVGIFFAFLTLLGNMAYQEFRRRRDFRQELKDEMRKQELHAAEMQLKAAQLKKVEHSNGPHSNTRDRSCTTE
ncbi:HP1 family phage holin [Shewanella glacialipiscicola]|uniref:HP1 family phage holin n=1 Tax=Shewanella glacialipiscicola TaxID=614069 RepID=UPI003D7BEAD3